MDYNFSWPDVSIEPRLRLARNIALIGVFRELSKEVPDDAVIYYLVNNDCCGLKESIFDAMWPDGGIYCSKSETTLNKPKKIVIPDALRKMANEYFISLLVDELWAMTWSSCRLDVDDRRFVQTLPRKVREVLDNLQVTAHATLMDHKPAVDAFHAVVCNAAIETIESKTINSYSPRLEDEQYKRQNFDVVTPKQFNKLQLLDDMVRRTIRDISVKGEMPGPYEWNALCDLFEAMLLVKYCKGFMEASNTYSIYLYAKMAEVGRERGKKFTDIYSVRALRDLYSGAIDIALDIYSKLSPKATLMVGHNARIESLRYECGLGSNLNYWDSKIIKRYLEFKTPKPSTAVKLFMQYELAIERRKMSEISRTLKSHAHTCRRDYDECEDAPCCCG